MKNWIIAIGFVFFAGGHASAATLVVDPTGQLVGINNLAVGSEHFDVSFYEDCTAAYSDCTIDGATALPAGFSPVSAGFSLFDALDPSNADAIVDLNGNATTNFSNYFLAPAGVLGCSALLPIGTPYSCGIAIIDTIPFAPIPGTVSGAVASIYSFQFFKPDNVVGFATFDASDLSKATAPFPVDSYAVFSPVESAGGGPSPVPLGPSAAYLLFGIAGLAGISRKKKR